MSFTADRAASNDLSDGYYEFNQTVVARKDSAFAKVTSVAGLKTARLGAQVGTTSLDAIQNVIKPTTDASVYDSNDAAIQALEAKQIDGLRRRPPDRLLPDDDPDRGHDDRRASSAPRPAARRSTSACCSTRAAR